MPYNISCYDIQIIDFDYLTMMCIMKGNDLVGAGIGLGVGAGIRLGVGAGIGFGVGAGIGFGVGAGIRLPWEQASEQEWVWE